MFKKNIYNNNNNLCLKFNNLCLKFKCIQFNELVKPNINLLLEFYNNL